MLVSQREAKRFIDWLERYNHPNYQNLGEALLNWLSADGGAFRLDCSYEKFLKMIIAVILSANKSLKVCSDRSLKVGDAQVKYRELTIPSTLDGWLPAIPSNDDFFNAVRKAVSEAKGYR